MDTLRYILIIPTTISAWLSALFISLRVEYYRAVLFCPEGYREGSDCYVESWEMWPLWLVTSGAVLSAVSVVVMSAIVAPRNKFKISAYAYLIGVFVAILFGIFSGYLIPCLASVVMGWLAVLVVARLTNASIATVFPRLRRSKTAN